MQLKDQKIGEPHQTTILEIWIFEERHCPFWTNYVSSKESQFIVRILKGLNHPLLQEYEIDVNKYHNIEEFLLDKRLIQEGHWIDLVRWYSNLRKTGDDKFFGTLLRQGEDKDFLLLLDFLISLETRSTEELQQLLEDPRLNRDKEDFFCNPITAEIERRKGVYNHQAWLCNYSSYSKVLEDWEKYLPEIFNK